MSLKFIDNSENIKGLIDEAGYQYLYSCCIEMEAQTKQNMPPGKWYSNIKEKWSYKIDEAKGEAIIGNPMEASLWVEFGTGEHALHNDGRKGYWVYVNDGSGKAPHSYVYKGGKTYTLAEAKKIVAFMRSKGLDAHCTNGQEPKRPFWHAFQTKKGLISKLAEQALAERLGK